MRPSSLMGVPTGVVSKAEHNSGAKKAGDPSVLRNALSSVSPTRPPTGLAALDRARASDTCETPKSEILAVRLSCVHKRLAGLISRWMMPLKCTVGSRSLSTVSSSNLLSRLTIFQAKNNVAEHSPRLVNRHDWLIIQGPFDLPAGHVLQDCSKGTRWISYPVTVVLSGTSGSVRLTHENLLTADVINDLPQLDHIRMMNPLHDSNLLLDFLIHHSLPHKS